MDYYFDGFTTGNSKIRLYFVAAEPFRVLCIAIGLFVLSGSPVAQCLWVISIELIYLAYLGVSNTYVSTLEEVIEIVRIATLIVYVILRLITMLDVSENTRQQYFGAVMAIMLICLIIFELIYRLYFLIRSIIIIIRTYLQIKS